MKPSNRFILIMAGILFGKLLGVSGSSLTDFVSETFLNDDGQVRYEGRIINYRSRPRNSGFPILYVGQAVDQASGITATVGETENFDHPEDASQKAIPGLTDQEMGILRERGLVVDQVQQTLPDSSPTKMVPLEPELKAPEPQPSAIPEQVIPPDQEPAPEVGSQQAEEDGHGSNDPPLSEQVCEKTPDKKEKEDDEEPYSELEPEPNQKPGPDNKYSNDEGDEVPLPDNQSSDVPGKDQGLLVDHAAWWSMGTLMTVSTAIIVASISCYFLDRRQVLPANVSAVFSAILGILLACTFGWTYKIFGKMYNVLSKSIQKAINVTLKVSKSFSNLGGVLQPFGAVLEVVPDYKGSYAACAMKTSHPTPDMLAPKYNYQLTSASKGIAFILNNFDFDKYERQGSQIDLGNVDHLFRELGYMNIIHENLTGNKIVESLRLFAAMFNEASYDSAVVVLMSHGDTGVILGTDLAKVKVRDLERELEGDRCPGLKGKPKMYFVQACRGDSPIIAPVVADGPSPQAPLGEECNTGPLDVVPDNDFTKHTTDIADVHIAFSTSDGQWSLRSEVIGSFFVQALCEVFFANAHQDNLDTLMNKVAYRVDRMKGKLFDHTTGEWINVKQTPECIKRGMRKSLYFLPKYHADKFTPTV